MIPVTKPYLPKREKLDSYIDGIYERNRITNNGPLVQLLTERLKGYLGVENLLLVSNGTLALQIACRSLGVCGSSIGRRVEAITTPFTFVATASALKWEGLEPVFVDIDKDSWCLDPENIKAAISDHTRCIVPVHVFGNACEVESIDEIAKTHGLKVIYDGAHAFGVTYKGESLLRHGDAATLSFHATKLFHTVEGGAIIFRHKGDLDLAREIINFGITGEDTIETLGINAKMNEFQAAMGLCVLDEIEENLRGRAAVWRAYDNEFRGRVLLQKRHDHASNNYAYFPLAMESEKRTRATLAFLRAHGILARRYFYPSLASTEVFKSQSELPKTEKLSKRIMCLPIYASLDPSLVVEILNEAL